MVNIDLLLVVAFGIVLFLFMWFRKKHVHVERLLFPLFYLVMYKTKLGIPSMNKFAKKHPLLLRSLGVAGVLIGFFGMMVVFFLLIQSAIEIFTNPDAQAGVDILLPGRSIPGLPHLSFWHWIIALFILAIVHEFAHGILARVHKVKIKSSGFAIFGIILPILPAAFVEPDEKTLQKKSAMAQLSVFAAGSLSNFLTGAVFALVFFLLFNPIASALTSFDGLRIENVTAGLPAESSGLVKGNVITTVNNVPVKSTSHFTNILAETKPNETITVEANNTSFTLTTIAHPDSPGKGFIGVTVEEARRITLTWWSKTFFWLHLLVFWIGLINILVGLFNLFPIVILDGGRMFHTLLLTVTKNEKLSRKIFSYVNIVCILLLLINFWPRIANIFTKIF